MKPEEPSNSQSGMSLSQQGPAPDTSENNPHKQSQDAAAHLIRSDIDNLYQTKNETEITTNPAAQQPQTVDVNPYNRTHTENPSPTMDEWKQYHTAWQNYYQQYYEGYYTHHLEKARQTLSDQGPTNQPTATKALPTDEAIFDMRQDLIGKIQRSASKIKKSRHFIPILSGIVVALVFLFLQYNRLIVSNIVSYVSPGSIDPQNIVIDPNTDLTVAPDPRLIIPKINVDVPVIYDIESDYNSQMAAMTRGVAQFAIPGANSHPGEIGNTVIAGHSSNDLLDVGDYKFIFAQLDKLEAGDTIYANYKSKRYTYTVTGKEVVAPTDVSKLVYPTTQPVITLLTCTPLGTSTNRLLVIATQISPDPAKSSAAPSTTKSDTKSIPGDSPSIFDRLFGSKY